VTELDGKVALITGAGAGIGEATAELFAAEGARVIVVDIDTDRAEAVAARIGAEALVVDVRDAAQVEQMRDDVLSNHGQLDVLVNNVGHWVRLPPSFAESDADQWQALY